MNNNYMAHYGIKGMRWGVRRTTNKMNSTNSNSNKKEQNPDRSKVMRQKISSAGKTAVSGILIAYGASMAISGAVSLGKDTIDGFKTKSYENRKKSEYDYQETNKTFSNGRTVKETRYKKYDQRAGEFKDFTIVTEGRVKDRVLSLDDPYKIWEVDYKD